MDTLTPEQRHKNMSHIRSKDTALEKKVRSLLFRAGFRFRIYDKKYPGKPDMVLPKYYSVIFINGCFWHAHENCEYFVFPKSNKEFWKKKFDTNKARDAKVLQYYKDQCWRVCIIWECSVKGKKTKEKTEKVVEQIMQWLEEPDSSFLEIRS